MSTATTGETQPQGETIPKDEAGYRAHMHKKLVALQEAEGEAHIQKLLQAEIQNVKKRNAEVTALDKQLRQQKRDTELARSQLFHFQDLKKKGEVVCQTLQTAIKKRDELTKAMAEEMKANREEAIAQTREKVQSFKDSTEERKKLLEETEKENEELRQKAEALQESFKAEYEKFQEELTNMFAPSEELKALQAEASAVNELQEQLKQKEAENAACVTGAKMMEQQIEWYNEHFKQFEEIAVDPEAVKVIVEKQRAAGEERIAETRKEAEKIKNKRLELEKELKEFRVKYAALTTKLVQVESNKKAAEKKCRQAQFQKK